MKRRAYFTRLLLSFFIISIIPLVAAGIAFYAASLRIVNNANSQRGVDAISIAAETIEQRLDLYRHIAYTLSKRPQVSSAFTADKEKKDSTWLKGLYRVLYGEIAGHLYDVSVHLIAADGSSAYSTHQLPAHYDLSNYVNQDGIFSEERPDPDRTYLYFYPFISEKGDRVACSFFRELENGYLILDILAAPLFSEAEQRVFDSMILAETEQLQAVDFYRAERDGTFDHFEELRYLLEEGADRYNEGRAIIRDNVLLIVKKIPGSSLILLGSMSSDRFRFALSALWKFGSWILIGISVLVVLLAYYISRDIGGPVHDLASAMEHLSDGIPPRVSETGRNDELGYLVISYNRMVGRLEELLERTREEALALRIAERKALQAQVHPHFLFNTLGTIKSIAKLRQVPEIVDITTALGKMLRAAAGDGIDLVPFSTTVELLQSYIAIQYYRFGDRLQASFNVDDSVLSFLVPRLILQPLVENAVIHSLEASPGPVHITITAQRRGIGMDVRITDDGPGIAPERLDEILKNGIRVGISNVKRRMELLYQGEGHFSITSSVGTGTEVYLFFPGEQA